MRVLILSAILSLLAAPALAQERSPAERQTLVDLAYVLGETHALRQACAGAGDQHWRTRMVGMVEAEAPDQALEDRLKGAFNNGFAARQTEFPTCAPETRRAEAAAVQRGQALAGQLAAAVRVVRRMGPDGEQEALPDSVAEDPAPR